MTYDHAVRYLLSLGRELASPRQARTAKFGLENISALTERLGHPERSYRSVHIAGTNGKGSTAAMLASILHSAGFRTGLYTSPHLLRINERIQVDGAAISDSDFAATFALLHDSIEELLATGKLAAHPTFFECITAMAFEFFAFRNVEIAVFEVGMGGRLDSTNVIIPDVAAITQIDFDHENFLGHSIREIAEEKAGIIKPHAWVVSAAGNEEANRVIRDRAAEQSAFLVEIDSSYRASGVLAEDGCYRFTALELIGSQAHSEHAIEVALPIPGRYQVRNALTALAISRLLSKRGLTIDDSAIKHGLASVDWPGRIQRLQHRPAIFVDGTHNPAGARELASFWKEHLSGRRIHLVYGAMRDKAVDEVAGLLFPLAATVTLTQSPQPRSISAEALAGMTRHLSPSLEVIPDPSAAFQRALERANPDDVVFVTGSLYLVGDLLRYWSIRTAGAPSAASLLPAR